VLGRRHRLGGTAVGLHPREREEGDDGSGDSFFFLRTDGWPKQ
jgi:hypothetical protein